TAWHDYMGGPVSGWQHRYSSHIKNAAVYAEAAHWAAGEYLVDVNAYMSDIDIDGVDELIIHNDRVFAVFESIGGRAQYIFSKGPGAEVFSIVGSCNTYWNETDGDYDEPGSNNHQACFADVSPHYRNDLYSISVLSVTGTTASIELSYSEVTKVIEIELGNPYLKASYDIGPQDGYIKHGMTPDLLGLIWNADMDRVWNGGTAYMGFRNPNSGATGALVLGNGGAYHNLEFSGTLLRGDEIRGYDRFAYLLYAGPTSAPNGSGEIAELEALESINLDDFGPRLNDQAAFINANTVEVTFNEAVDLTTSQIAGNWSLQNFTGSYSVTAAVRQGDWRKVRLTVSPNLPGGESGEVVVSNVLDLNSNLVDPAYDTATLAVSNGLTPHTIIIDGTKDFNRDTECLYAGTDTLTITWDATYLYVGYWNKNLATGDLFIDIDTNQLSGSGAASGSWGRVNFANPFRIEYQIAIEGGGNSMQINYWTGAAWTYVQYGTHGGFSYEGWATVPYTEVRIPWSDLGNPTGIALAVHVTQEDNLITDRVFPTVNPTGNNITISSFYRIYAPYASGPLPLMGVETQHILVENPVAPEEMVITVEAGIPHLQWLEVENAHTYSIYRAEAAAGPFLLLGTTEDLEYFDLNPPAGEIAFYEVTATGGI
ncbi:hypothetical protein KKH18_05540, partial [bacterium]|nr:hypothetical protein [bacterium]